MDCFYCDNEMIDKRLLRAIGEMGFEQMTPIQEQAIPVLLSGRDLIGQAQTGTGKTAAFGIPMLQMVDPENRNLQSIILCPTRELAIQAAGELRKLAAYMHGIKVVPIYGGQDIGRQLDAMRGGVQIVVGTPGRVMDHMRRHTLKMKDVKLVVLDEADEMLSMGFCEDIETILTEVTQEHQTALFSATMPQSILDITNRFQKNAVMLKITKQELTIPLIQQTYYEISMQRKTDTVIRLLEFYNLKRSLIFCNTKRMVDELTEELKKKGCPAECIHGDLSQMQRDKVMNGFRNGRIEILIATDVAARGIDVDDVEAVFNYDIPQDIEYYVHRIGRTGRAGKTGRSFTLVCGRDIYKIRDIERLCKTKITPSPVPTGNEVNAAKAQRCLQTAKQALQEVNIDLQLKYLEAELAQGQYTALELAAVMLRMQMGDESKDIPTEKYEPYPRRGRRDMYGARVSDRDYGRRSYGGQSERRSTYAGQSERRSAYAGQGERYSSSRTAKGVAGATEKAKKPAYKPAFRSDFRAEGKKRSKQTEQ